MTAKKGTCFNDAALAGLQLLAIERSLSLLVLETDCLTVRAKDQLAAMQVKLRRMRHEIEVSANLPDLWRNASGAGPSGIPRYTGRQGAYDCAPLTTGKALTNRGLTGGQVP